MGRYKKSKAESIFKDYKKNLEYMQHQANKNFNDMDFENADARDEVEYHVSEIIKSCQKLLDKMDEYTFS